MVSVMDEQRRQLNRRIIRSLERGLRFLTKGQRVSLTLSRTRMGLVLGCVTVCAVLYNKEWFVTGNWVLAGCFAGFLVLVHVHNRLKDRLHRLRVWLHIQTRNLSCLNLEWMVIPETEITLASEHPYGADLDVVGPRSLLRLLDVTVSQEGRNRLIDWMVNQNTTPLSYDEWQRRQTLVQTLTPLQGLRTRLQLAAACVSQKPINGDRVTSLLQESLPVSRVVPLLVTTGGLAALNLFLFLFWAVGGGPAYWIISFLVYALVTLLAGGRLSHVFERTLDLHVELKKLGVVIGILETRSFSRLPAIQTLTEPLRKGKGQPSVAIAQLARVCSGLSVKGHPIIHVALNFVVPWDLAWTWSLQRVRADFGPCCRIGWTDWRPSTQPRHLPRLPSSIPRTRGRLERRMRTLLRSALSERPSGTPCWLTQNGLGTTSHSRVWAEFCSSPARTCPGKVRCYEPSGSTSVWRRREDRFVLNVGNGRGCGCILV